MPSKLPYALDLFCGAGGFSLGLEKAGMRIAGAIEIDRFAVETYHHNFPTVPIWNRSVESCSDKWIKRHFSGIDVIVGGPPCQGFSVAGPSQYKKIDQRNSLIMEMARFARLLKPRMVVLENVRGILSGRTTSGAAALTPYLEALKSAGYLSKIVCLQAADFGIPQIRQRVFIMSFRQQGPLDKSFWQRKGRWRTVEQAISDLPPLNPGEGHCQGVPYTARPKNNFQRRLREGASEVVFNHVAMRHSDRVLRRIEAMRPGDSMKTVDGEHGQRERNSHVVDAKNRYKMNYTRLLPQAPSISITANFQTIHVHPFENRMLTAREGARLQSFPDHFVFKGPRTLPSRKLLERENRHHEIGLSQYNQIGNAVPPLLAETLGQALLECM